ncbi:MAG: hypothetical protein KC940_16515 [Candidatus Omnitrophica bacterium]|nr:hypothetical protein [Candidatus Omnitrophota bacterium]MCB9784245.1 hypothetical protein [Candidatus Omnitrophota bacterium]
MGYAEEVAQCWDEPTIDGFEGEITREIRTKIESELMNLNWPEGDEGERMFTEVEEEVWSQVIPLQWGEEDIEDAVREAYKHIVGKTEPTGD